MPSMPQIRSFHGPEIEPWLDQVARLGVPVFRQCAYRCRGNRPSEHERCDLRPYVGSRDSVLVLALDEGRVVGASTGLPLLDDADAFVAPLQQAGLPAAQVFYFGESVL